MSYTFDLAALNQKFECAPPQAILEWAAREFGDRVVVSSSFQTQSVALLHLISEVVPQLRVIFVDTLYHFPETLAYRDQLVDLLGINVVTVSAEKRQDFDGEGNPLHRVNPDLCCALHKTAPMSRTMADCDAWISGIRRDQTATRRQSQPVERQSDGLYKVNALLNWTSRDLWTYINRHDLPAHPLFSQGYASIGCAPCTTPPLDPDNPRSGRWSGHKLECGIHVQSK